MAESFVGGLENAPESSSPPETPAGASSPPAEGGGQPAGSDQAPAGWLAGLAEDERGYVGGKGWREPSDLLKSYRELEEVMGAKSGGRALVLPKDENDREAFDKVYEALGRPAEADGYGLGEMLADYPADPEFLASMGQAMHQAGLSTKQAQSLAQAYQAAEQAVLEQHRRAHNEGVAQVGDSFSPAEKDAAKRGFNFLGISDQEARTIEIFLGVPRAAEVFKKIGTALGEDRAPAGNGAADPIGSPTAARDKIGRLMADPLFSKRYLDGDRDALAQMERLAKQAAGQ